MKFSNFPEFAKLTFSVIALMILQIIKILPAYSQEEDLSVLKRWLRYTDASNALYHHLADQAIQHLTKRAIEVTQLTTRNEWLIRQQEVQKVLLEIVGPFPEKTPLNAKIVEIVNKNGYRIEKIIFESLPKFYVTACLFVPEDLKGKTPTIIYCSGHSNEGFRVSTYQQVILNLVRKGFIVFAFDPVGQGERLQYFDSETGESRVGGPTKEHSYPGAQCFLIGSSQARYMIWDGIRAVDYLLTRKEVDPDRIGITGRSGGGTQSAYIAAFDDRILAVAPECYITSFQRLFESIGPQDAEQNFYHGVANGIDHADLLEVRAPKPVLVITTTRDFFSIQGARETDREVKSVYQAFGQEDNFAMVEDDAVHTSTPKNREAIYAFFQKHLNLPGSSMDEEIEYLTLEELRVTQTGQVSTSSGGETVFTLNKAEAGNRIKNLEKSRRHERKHLEMAINAAKTLSGFKPPQSENQAIFTGRYWRDGYAIEKYFIKGEGEYPIPFILMIPKQDAKHPVVIYLHPNGKTADATIGGEMEWLVKQGFAVLAPDLVGIGEMGPGDFRGDAYDFKLGSASYNIWFAAIQIGRSLVGIQAGDIIRIVDFLQNRDDVDLERIAALARGEMCPILLHAAAFDNRISKIALVEPLISYRSLVTNQYYKPSFMLSTVAGALTAYDLPDLCASLAPRNLLMINVADQNGKVVGKNSIDEELAVVKFAFASIGAEKKFEIRRQDPFQGLDEVFGFWLKDFD